MMRSSSQNDREVMFSMWHKEKEVSNRKKTVASRTKQLGVTSFLQAIHTQTHVLANPSPHEGSTTSIAMAKFLITECIWHEKLGEFCHGVWYKQGVFIAIFVFKDCV